jgi:hypothetical protein
MALEVINVGSSPNDGLGDPLRTAFIKCNNNFSELFGYHQDSAPASSVGSEGDVAGMTAYDGQFWYWCTGDYDGTTLIWYRVTGSTF